MINNLFGFDPGSPPGPWPSLAAFLLRLALGLILIPHGYRKLYETKSGPREISAGLRNIGIPAPLFFAYAIGIVEFYGGIALILGFLTRAVAFAAGVDMFVAIMKVKFKTGLMSRVMNGGWVGGYELDLALLVIALVLVILGAGTFAVDWIVLNQW